MLPLTVSQLARYLGGSSNNQQLLFSASVDSRKRGDLFFALPGNRQDGHDFLQQAAESGTVAAVVSKGYAGSSYGLELIFVDDVLQSLQNLGHLAVRQSGAKIVAVTGSLGKTTTKHFLTALLQSRFSVFSDGGNANSQIGLPLALLALQGEEIAVVEMGMTDYGHIKRLIEIAPPDVALITTVSLVHALSFEGILSIAEAKAEIFSHTETWHGLFLQEMPGSAIARAMGSCPKTTFSVVDREAAFFAELQGKQIFVYEEGQLCLQAFWPILGRHNIQNFLAAAAAAKTMGLSWHDIANAVPRLSLPARRLQLVEKKGMLFINDSYNASRESICSALETLTEVAGTRRRVAVLSEMLELGRYAEEEHRAVGSYALGKVDQIYCIGAGARPIKALFEEVGRSCHYYEDKEELKKTLQNDLKEGDVVLVKGGRLYNLGDLLEHI